MKTEIKPKKSVENNRFVQPFKLIIKLLHNNTGPEVIPKTLQNNGHLEVIANNCQEQFWPILQTKKWTHSKVSQNIIISV